MPKPIHELMPHGPERDILSCFHTGDEHVFREIYNLYASPLRYFAAKYISEKEVIDDIVQDAFVALWEKRKDFSAGNAMKAFLYRVVQRNCLNTIRHQKVKSRYVTDFRQEEEKTFLDNIVEAEVFKAVLSVFEELTPATKEVYRLSMEGLKHEEIAEKLQITVNTVKKHKNIANHFMRERLKQLWEILFILSP